MRQPPSAVGGLAPRARSLPLLERAGALSARLNLPLVAIFAAGVAFTAYYSLKVSEWSVMTDELLYVKLAISIGDTGSPLPQVHGQDFAVFNQLYPLLTAPIFGLFDMPDAFRVVHFVNALLLASTAIPTYLLAREVAGSRAGAYIAAAIAIAVPWMTMSTMVLTESAAYPAFAWALIAMQRAIAEPSTRRDLVALLAVAIAFLARTQFLLLAPVLVAAVLVHEVGFQAMQRPRPRQRAAIRRGIERSLRRHRVLAIVSAAGVLVAIPAALAGALTRSLGNYHVAAEDELLPAGIGESLLVHLDFLVVAIGVVPFVLASAWAASTLLRPVDRRAHAYASLTLVTVGALLYQVTSFDINFAAGGVQDRYLFYLVPLLVVGMVACLCDVRRPWVAVLGAGAAFAAIAGVADYAPSGGPYFGSPASAFHVVLEGRAWSFGQKLGIDDLSPSTAIQVGSVLLTLALAAVVRYLPRQMAIWGVGLAVLGFCVVESRYVFERMVLGKGGARSISGTSLEGRDWVDATVPADASVALVPAPITLVPPPSEKNAVPVFVQDFESTWWYTEAWNKSVDRAYSYAGSTTYTPFPESELSLDYATGRLIASEQSEYLLVTPSDARFRPAGRVIGGETLELVRPSLPYRAEWASRRVGADGWTRGGEPATIRVYGGPSGAAGRRVSVTLSSTGDIEGRRRYSIHADGDRAAGSVPSGGVRTEALELCVPARGSTDITIDVPRSTELRDDRVVGLRVVQVRSVPASGACPV